MKPILFRPLFVFLLAAWAMVAPCAPIPAIAETGLPFLRNFTPQEYGAHGQNWAVVQDPRGVIYVANNSGILEYDGVRWRLIPVPNRSAIRSLAVDSRGRVYVGAKGELGYLAPDPSHEMTFVSLLSKIPAANRNFADVWKICCTSSGVHFSTSSTLFRYADEQFQTWSCDQNFSLAFAVENRLFIRQRGKGLLELKGQNLNLVPHGERFSSFGPAFMLPFGKAILIGTQRNGLFTLKEDQVEPFRTDFEALLTNASPSHAIQLTDGTLAISTLQEGVLIASAEGKLLRHLDKRSGLQENEVKQMFLDDNSGLWLALNRGLTRLQWPCPLSRFGDANGLEGTIVAIRRHRDHLYICTSQGLFRLETSPSDQRIPSFKRIEALGTACWDLNVMQDHLLVAGDRGVYTLDDGRPQLIFPSTATCLRIYSSICAPDRVFIGLTRGLASLRWDHGRWMTEGLVPGLTAEVRNLQEDSKGRLWLRTATSGILRITWKPGPSAAPIPQEIRHFGIAEGLSSEMGNSLVRIQDEILVSGLHGTYRFDPVSEQFQPDGHFTELTTRLGHYRMDAWEAGPKGKGLLAFSEDSSTPQTRLATLRQDGIWHLEPSILSRLDGTLINASHSEPDGTIWFGGPEGLFRLDGHLILNTDARHGVLVRRVSKGSGVQIFGGAGQSPHVPEIRHRDNSLRFEFSAPGTEPEGAIRYQVFLEGYDQKWSDWTSDAFKEFTNLPAGHFKFHVRGRDLYGNNLEGEAFPFQVLPPWYLAWWAWMVYGTLLVAQTYGLIRWRNWKLRTEKALLETKVQQRTQELAESHAKLQDAQEHIARLMESPSNLLEDIPSWASAVARDIQTAIGAKSVGVYEWIHGQLKTIHAAEEGLPEELAQRLDSDLTHFDDNLVFPVRGLSGGLLGVVVAQGLHLERLGPERQLLSGFANQLGNALEMLQIRRKLLVAEAQRASSIQELHARGIETLKICPRCGLCYGHETTHCHHDLEALDTPELLPLRILDRYRFVRRLGSGGMGTVFQALDEHLGRDVAVKLMRAELFNNTTARLRFEREARSVVQVNHPGVVTVYDSGEVGDGTLYLVMELLRGMSLDNAIRRFGPASSSQVARILRQGAEALEAAHRARIIHRDIKPQNIFLVPSLESFQIKLVDFGLAKSIDSETQVTQTGLLLGTPGYLAPEIVLGQPASEQSDFFAFAAVVYEALSGWSMVQATTLSDILQALLYGTPVHPTELAPWLPKDVDEAFQQMFAKQPQDRPESILAWAQELANVMEEHPGPGDGWPDPLPLQDEIRPENATSQVSALRSADNPPETEAFKHP